MSFFTIYQYKKATVERGAVQYKNITNYLQSNKILFDEATYTPLYQYNFEISKEMAKSVSSSSCNTERKELIY